MTVKDVLKKKGYHIWSVHRNQSVYDALRILVQQNIGAVVVLDDYDRLAGMISERDIMNECYFNSGGFAMTPVCMVMTPRVITVSPKEEIDDVMTIMTTSRVRHLPVLTGNELSGLISIGDVVRAQLRDYKAETNYLKEYLFG